jgi:hypothetical protein
MTVFNNRRQENICCYNNLEWQLMIEWVGNSVVFRRIYKDLRLFDLQYEPYRQQTISVW